ncbi:MAG: hypothetical protein KF760_26220 [Candidatus Eremiobacteraeota bacterium]|nr:hypothetical protein [Candidatus Eremiobacteraeota bacterium]MCW5869555.1 hypothetical protein [Candidatus Eremiobacteraeota bacterium]
MAIIGPNFNSFATFGFPSGVANGPLSSGTGLTGLGVNQAQDFSGMMLQALSLMSGGWGSVLSGANNYSSLEALAQPLSSQYAGLTGVSDVNTMLAQMGGIPSSISSTGTSFANLDSSYYTQLMSGFDSQLNALMAQYGLTS